MRLYTDGSKMGLDTGYGAVLFNDSNKIVDTINGILEDDPTVFQAECVAIQQGLTLLDNIPKRMNVQILNLDNQALVQALANKATESAIVKDTKETMNA